MDIESAIIDLIKEKYIPEKKNFNLNYFADSAEELSAAFTSERGSLPKNYFNQPKFRTAYLLYFYLQTYHKTLYCLNFAKDLGFKIDSILDVGAGFGPSSMAAANLGSKQLTLLDQNKKSLQDAVYLAKKLTSNTSWEYIDQSIETSRSNKKHDGIILANFLNEISKNLRFTLISNLIKYSLKDDGFILIIEPALRITTRDLMELRDEITKNNLFIHAPCLHQSLCPMLKTNDRDWCHMYLHWNAPKLIEKLDKLTRRNHKYLKFSYLILSQKKPAPIKTKALIVSSPLVSKGKTEILACSSSGKLERLRILHRDDKKSLKDKNRGDIITL